MDEVKGLFNDMEQWKPKVHRFITYIISFILIVYIIYTISFLMLPEGAIIDNFAKFIILENIVVIIASLIIFLAILFYSFSENDKIQKVMRICCFILIAEAIFNIGMSFGLNISRVRSGYDAAYDSSFYVNFFVIPFTILILYLYRRGN